jgi:50S ribosomal protein L16 3-hydroxylase
MTVFYLSKAYDPPQAPQNLPLDCPWALLGWISPEKFMKSFWHKKPLLVRGAIPAFELAQQSGQPLLSPISPKALFTMAGDQALESRLIRAKPWSFIQGPFKKKSIPSLDTPDWTLLLQGMEEHHPAAAKILSWFRFIPDARLDDLMISIAGPGGGVGPHFDSYDVFLIQMAGRRRWRISEQSDLTLNPNLPLKILQHFKSEQVWDLNPGDMLYLPPQIAHDGIALDPGCQTWSVGFRAQSYKEILQEGLWRLAESLEAIPELEKRFADPGQMATHIPEQLPDEMIRQLAQKLSSLKLNQIDTFLPGIAAYLSEPKPQAFFDSASSHYSAQEFSRHLNKHTLMPHPQTRLLALGKTIYCNGEDMTSGQTSSTQKVWRLLAQKKQYQGASGEIMSNNSLLEAFDAGWLLFEG